MAALERQADRDVAMSSESNDVYELLTLICSLESEVDMEKRSVARWLSPRVR